jgi:ribosome biogenesis GTPase A
VPHKNLTPYDHIPMDALVSLDLKCKESPVGSKFLQACLLGAPNAGKSSLINALVGKNISAVSNKYNTTDEATRGIFTDVSRKT